MLFSSENARIEAGQFAVFERHSSFLQTIKGFWKKSVFSHLPYCFPHAGNQAQWNSISRAQIEKWPSPAGKRSYLPDRPIPRRNSHVQWQTVQRPSIHLPSQVHAPRQHWPLFPEKHGIAQAAGGRQDLPIR